ncbi:MAG: ABC transporter permease, partial [Acidobacteria bacterium]|nr:ABC transporter permease [Acidobacteriota bacterium]
MSEFLQDLRVGVRQLVRRPAFALTAIGSLALGIGLTTTLFTVVNAVLFKSSPLRDPAQLVEIYSGQRGEDMQLTTSYPDLQSLRAGVPALSGLAGHAYVRGVLSTGATPLLVMGETVTANYFDVLGVPMAMGRAFRADEDATPDGAPVAVVSHGLWQRQLGGRPDVVGSTVKLSGLSYTVIGIAPETFPGTMPGIASQFWVPVTMVERLQFTGMQWSGDDTDPGTTRLDRRSTRWLFVKGRLAEGQTVAQARAQAEAVFAQLASDHPITNEKAVVSLVPAANVRFHPMVDGYVRAASAGLLGAVGLVLLIACATVAALLLARGTARRREMAVRAAIGAGRGRLVRQLLSEGLVLATAGGVAGVLLAAWAGQLIGAYATTMLPIPTTFDFSLDRTVLLFAGVVSVVTALVFGLAPAWSASRPELVPALKDTLDSGGGTGRRRVTLRDALVVGQLALSLVLLVSGALLARGLVVARGIDLGFDPSRVAYLVFSPQMNGYDTDRSMALRARALDAVKAVPGVTAASLSTRLPLGPDINMNSYAVPGRHDADDDGVSVDTTYVGADYFTVMGIPLVEGRGFTDDEATNDRKVLVVNETFAKTYWPGESAVGRVMHPGGLDQPAFTIVGVSRDHKVRSAGEAPMPYAHLPIGRGRSIELVVRTAGPAAAVMPALKKAVWALEPDAVFTAEGAASEAVETTLAPTRIGAAIIGVVGVLALLLAAVGLYGVIAYSVSLRTREVGIRLALGAERGQVLRMVLGQGARLALVGIGLGAVLAAAAASVLQSMLYGVSAIDPLADGAAALLLLMVALAANLAPAITA